ncbi:MAG: hypothetical protein NZ953_03580 [Thaumarchaeota archaeon]|nr:hypothetical protein [Candidatus Calditenuaceae archaeon]MDW8042807.1 hypothetical protein [Nitrososphaerota archaeon]
MNFLLDPFQRANLYVSIFTLLQSLAEGSEPPVEVREFLEALGVEVPELDRTVARELGRVAARDVRVDLPEGLRRHLHLHLRSFAERMGYEVPEPADGLINMVALAARLAMDAFTAGAGDAERAEELERALLRFLMTHLLPVLEDLSVPDEGLRRLIGGVVDLIKADVEDLKAKFTARS